VQPAKTPPYTRQRRHFTKTRPTQVAIGTRAKPQPNARTGFIRVETVHLGDLDRIKGVYHVNAVDEVTPLQFVLSTQKISERYLLPVLEELRGAFAFTLESSHAEHGSEFINHRVARSLNKRLIELPKSRPRHANDNALAESQNGTVIGKHFRYEHIPQRFAAKLNDFHRRHFNPYINFHRPCFFPVMDTDAKGHTAQTLSL
jgi:transposase InsO family protein